jgi:hypothetical protein
MRGLDCLQNATFQAFCVCARTMAATEALDANSSAADFFVSSGCISSALRQQWACKSSHMGFSSSVLEVNSSNIMNFAQGEFSLVHDDMKSLLQPSTSAAALHWLQRLGSESAFHTRRDLVNFKKICLHMQEGGTHTCKDLKQLCAFFRTDTQNHESFFMPIDRYGSISDTMQECAGALDAVADGRRISKAMCCVPRMPNKPLSEYLVSCPRQLQSCKNVCDAEEFLLTAHALQLVGGKEQVQHIEANHPNDSSDMDYDTSSAISKMLNEPWVVEPQLADAAPSTAPAAYVVAASMTARGGWKALRMQRVLHHVISSLQQLLRRLEVTLHRLHALPSVEAVKELLLRQRESAVAAAADMEPAAAGDVPVNHRVLVGCAIKRRRFISLLTGTSITPPPHPPPPLDDVALQ